MKNMKAIFSIPNILCYIRILLIPLLLFLYINMNSYILSFILLVFMELTDLLDGYIARKFHLVTTLGKVVDPLADKLLQFSLIIMLLSRYPQSIYLLIFFIIKEGICSIFSIYTCYKTKVVDGAQIYGKISTVVFYLSALILIFWKNISTQIVNLLILVTIIFLVYACIAYVNYYLRILRKKH